MKNYYSKAEDCANLAIKLNNRLNNKIQFYGTIWQEVVSGYYHAIPLGEYSKYRDYEKDEVSFSFKYSEGEFLRLTIGEETCRLRDGLKLAVLSDFCEVLTELFGKPSFFYTVQDDEYHTMNLQWSYDHVKEDIESIQNGTYFEDAIVESLIVFKDYKENDLDDKSKEELANKTGLPIELLDLVEQNSDDFINAKLGVLQKKKESNKSKNKNYVKKL